MNSGLCLILALYLLIGCMIRTAVCEGLAGGMRDVCYAKEALRTRNSALCENVEEQITRDLCYAQISKLPDVLDIAICEKIQNEKTREVCYCDVCRQVRGTQKWDAFECTTKCPSILVQA